ncbi:OTU-like cysteine protease domain-containing protein [Phthorimaea operculella]|nr:OTU-like cysteine protease domain-containing protein [Phthorimaea operculella]
MEEGNGDVTSIETRHRKEKKELQAHIQALKKAAKNDKTKKKELVSEIARLEAEQEARHKQELEVVEQTAAPVDVADEIENELPKLKISKAQKRRDKKQQQEKEREEQIKLQEKENINGPRNTEVQAISERLKKKNLKIFLVPSDGDCLYKAVAHQLETVKQQILSIGELRRNVAEYIKSNKDDFIPFMSNPDTCDMLTEEEFEEYCDKITTTKVWGGQLEIRALSNCLKCPISVIQATGPESIEQGSEFQGPPLVITYHRHMYSLGEHYNSTCPNTNSEGD